MAKKQIIIFISIFVVIFGIGIGGIVYFKKNKNSAETSVVDNFTKPLSLTDSETIPLSGNDTRGNSGLSVDNSPSSSTNLGSVVSTNTNSGNTGASASNTTDFKQYEQYKDKQEVYFGDIVQGNGKEAVKDTQLAVTYKGYLTNGQMFDQSRTGANGQKEPLLFTLGAGQLIAGFEQGVFGMKAGGSRRIIIPPSLGYGDKEQSGIPPNSVLIFDVQLLTVQ